MYSVNVYILPGVMVFTGLRPGRDESMCKESRQIGRNVYFCVVEGEGHVLHRSTELKDKDMKPYWITWEKGF